MQDILGIIFIVLSAPLVVAQIISVLNFPLAQRLGLQEKSGTAYPLMRHLEINTAIWDLPTLIWLPVAGVLMMFDHVTEKQCISDCIMPPDQGALTSSSHSYS